MHNSPLVRAARSYINVKFRHRGRSKFSLDCAGLMVRSYADCRVDIHDFELYGPEPHRDGLLTHMIEALGKPVKIAPVLMTDLQDGDVVLMRFMVQPHHMGMIAATEYGDKTALNIIHADGHSGRVLEQRFTGSCGIW